MPSQTYSTSVNQRFVIVADAGNARPKAIKPSSPALADPDYPSLSEIEEMLRAIYQSELRSQYRTML